MKLPSKFYFFQLGPTPFLSARSAPACNNKGHGYPVFRGFSSYEQPNFSGSSDYVQMRLHSSLINFLVVFTLQNINPNAVQMNIIMWLGISMMHHCTNLNKAIISKTIKLHVLICVHRYSECYKGTCATSVDAGWCLLMQWMHPL